MKAVFFLFQLLAYIIYSKYQNSILDISRSTIEKNNVDVSNSYQVLIKNFMTTKNEELKVIYIGELMKHYYDNYNQTQKIFEKSRNELMKNIDKNKYLIDTLDINLDVIKLFLKNNNKSS